MCSVAMDYVNDSAMCQTLTEDVLLNLWEKKNELVITTSLRAYLLRAVRNKCIDYLRTQRQNSDFLGYYDSLDGMFGGAMADEKDLFEQLISDELAELLDRAIGWRCRRSGGGFLYWCAWRIRLTRRLPICYTSR